MAVAHKPAGIEVVATRLVAAGHTVAERGMSLTGSWIDLGVEVDVVHIGGQGRTERLECCCIVAGPESTAALAVSGKGS